MMYLETLGIDTEETLADDVNRSDAIRRKDSKRTRFLNINDPAISEDADYQSAWNPVVIARHVIQHRRTPLYSKFEFPEANRVLLPGEWDWMERENTELRQLPVARGRKAVLIPEERQAANIARNIATSNSPMKKAGFAIGEILTNLHGDTISHRFRPRRHRRMNHVDRFFASSLMGEDADVLGGWVSRLKRKARNVASSVGNAVHSGLNVATQIPGVSGIANTARAAGNLAHGELPSLSTIAGAMGAPAIPGIGNVVDIANKAGLNDILSSAQNLATGIAEGGAASAAGPLAAQQFLDRSNMVPMSEGAFYSSPSSNMLANLDRTAGKLVVPESLPARHIVREVAATDAEKQSWTKKNEKALLLAGAALTALAVGGGFAYYKHRHGKATVPAITEMA